MPSGYRMVTHSPLHSVLISYILLLIFISYCFARSTVIVTLTFLHYITTLEISVPCTMYAFNVHTCWMYIVQLSREDEDTNA